MKIFKKVRVVKHELNGKSRSGLKNCYLFLNYIKYLRCDTQCDIFHNVAAVDYQTDCHQALLFNRTICFFRKLAIECFYPIFVVCLNN